MCSEEEESIVKRSSWLRGIDWMEMLTSTCCVFHSSASRKSSVKSPVPLLLCHWGKVKLFNARRHGDDDDDDERYWYAMCAAGMSYDESSLCVRMCFHGVIRIFSAFLVVGC
jgi:hypothetical protein